MATAETTVQVGSDPFGLDAYINEKSVIITTEDRYPVALCNEIIQAFFAKYLKNRDPNSIAMAENALAEACSKGTSAKRFNTRTVISVSSIGLECTLGDFCALLPVDRDNNLRVWCESRARFADRTYHLIRKKSELRVEVSKANQCSLELAPVGFDYAGALSSDVYKSLGSVERQFIALNTTRKAGPSRSHVYEGESTDSGMNNPVPNEFKAAQVRQLPAPVKSSVGGVYGR